MSESGELAVIQGCLIGSLERFPPRESGANQQGRGSVSAGASSLIPREPMEMYAPPSSTLTLTCSSSSSSSSATFRRPSLPCVTRHRCSHPASSAAAVGTSASLSHHLSSTGLWRCAAQRRGLGSLRAAPDRRFARFAIQVSFSHWRSHLSVGGSGAVMSISSYTVENNNVCCSYLKKGVSCCDTCRINDGRSQGREAPQLSSMSSRLIYRACSYYQRASPGG